MVLAVILLSLLLSVDLTVIMLVFGSEDGILCGSSCHFIKLTRDLHCNMVLNNSLVVFSLKRK